MTNPETYGQVSAAISALTKKITIAAKAYNSTQYRCSLVIDGIDGIGKKINAILTETHENKDLKAFFENYAQTLINQRLLLCQKLETLPPPEQVDELIN